MKKLTTILTLTMCLILLINCTMVKASTNTSAENSTSISTSSTDNPDTSEAEPVYTHTLVDLMYTSNEPRTITSETKKVDLSEYTSDFSREFIGFFYYGQLAIDKKGNVQPIVKDLTDDYTFYAEYLCNTNIFMPYTVSIHLNRPGYMTDVSSVSIQLYRPLTLKEFKDIYYDYIIEEFGGYEALNKSIYKFSKETAFFSTDRQGKNKIDDNYYLEKRLDCYLETDYNTVTIDFDNASIDNVEIELNSTSENHIHRLIELPNNSYYKKDYYLYDLDFEYDPKYTNILDFDLINCSFVGNEYSCDYIQCDVTTLNISEDITIKVIPIFKLYDTELIDGEISLTIPDPVVSYVRIPSYFGNYVVSTLNFGNNYLYYTTVFIPDTVKNITGVVHVPHLIFEEQYYYINPEIVEILRKSYWNEYIEFGGTSE